MQTHPQPCGMPGDMRLQGGGIGEPDKGERSGFLKIDLAAGGERRTPRRDQRQAVFAEDEALDMLRQRMFGGKAEIGGAARDGGGDIGALALLDVDIEVGMRAQEGGERPRQMFREPGGIGEQVHARAQAARKAGEIAAHRFHILNNQARVVEQTFAGGCEFDAAASTLEQRHAERRLQALDPRAGRGQREVAAIGAACDAAGIGHCDEELEIDQIETHGANPHHGFGGAESWLHNLQIVPIVQIGQSAAMFEPMLLLIAAAVLFAGFVKGVLGLGLPTVSIGLLAVAMPPTRALAIVIAPAIIANVWQAFRGPYLRDIVRRLWPLMLGVIAGIWLNAGAMSGPHARYGTVVLGVLLVVYAIVGLSRFSPRVAPRNEIWVGGVVGVITGVISASTGVQVIPSMPFMQAIGMEKDELVQALGVFFTVATLTLSVNLTETGLLSGATALPGAVALIASFVGIWVGQTVRAKMPAAVFRRWFLFAMILLGLYLTGSAIYHLRHA